MRLRRISGKRLKGTKIRGITLHDSFPSLYRHKWCIVPPCRGSHVSAAQTPIPYVTGTRSHLPQAGSRLPQRLAAVQIVSKSLSESRCSCRSSQPRGDPYQSPDCSNSERQRNGVRRNRRACPALRSFAFGRLSVSPTRQKVVA